jgi:uncharacterized protein involved in outer membrane biogenesis
LQHTLLGAGLLLIAAIVAALAAPLFVDWNTLRAEFEQRASLLVNAPVTIRGPIEATILPLPAFAIHDVTIGGAEGGTGLRATQIRGALSLGALLRGRLEAEEIVFAKPDIRALYEADGKIVLPTAPSQTGAENFSISRVAFDGGTITIRDPEGKETKYEDVSGFGTLQSRAGPFKLEFSCKQAGQGFTIRMSANEFRDAAGKVRLVLTRMQDGIALEADGNLMLADARPRFEGKLGLTRRGDGALPWKLSADVRGGMQSVTLDELQLALGGDENAIELAGSGRLEPQAGKFEASFAAKGIDLDRFSGSSNGAKKDLISAIAPLRETLAQLSALPLSGRIGLSVDNLVAAGAVVRNLKGALALHDGLLMPQRFEARLPGLAAISFAGTAQDSDSVAGALKLTAEDPPELARWLGLDRLGVSFGDGASLRLDGEMRASKSKIAIAPFTLAYADAKLSGSATYSVDEPGKASRLDATLAADKPDLALLAALLPRVADSAGFDVAISLDARSPKLLGSVARRFDAAFTLAAGALSIDRLSLEDFEGLNLRASGRLASWRERPNGRVEIETDAARTDAFVSLVRAVIGTSEAAAFAKRIAAAAIPLRMKGAVTGDGASAEVAVELGGRASDIDAEIAVRLDPRSASLGDARIVAEARDAAGLVALLGLPLPEPHAGQGRLEATLGRPKEGIFPLKASLAFPGINLSGEGDLRAGAEGRITPRIELRLEATDARALSLAAARAANTVVPATGTARLVRGDDSLGFEDISLGLDDIRVRGRLSLKGVERPLLSGTLSMNRAELSVLLAIVLGHGVESAASPWPDRVLGPSALEDASGTIEIESAALGLVGPLVANGARLKLRFTSNEAAIEEFSGELAGGKLTGQARVARANPLVVDGNVSLAGGDVGRLMASSAARASMRGRANAALEFTAQGNTPAMIVANVAGRGSIVLEGFEIDKLDPEALTKVAPAANAPPLTEAEAAGLLAFGLQKGPLRIAKLEAPIVVTSGVARTGRTRTAMGPVEVTSETSFDLGKFDLDAAIGLALTAPERNAARSEAVIRWRGPLTEPKRSIDASAIVAALSSQAMDSEMRKIDGRPVPSPPAIAAPAAVPPASVPLPRRRPAEIPPPAAAELPPLPPPLEIGPAPGNSRLRPNPFLQ